MTKKFTLSELGYEAEIGKVARQADGSVWLKQGDTVILATAVSVPPKDFPGFLPLSVDYREQFAAAGKIPGGYYKREGKFSDKEILTARLVDRAIRPLFPANYFNQLQVLITVYSADKKYPPNSLALLAGSIALSTSSIPFLGPVGSVEVNRVNGTFVTHASYEEAKASEVRLVFAGTADGIVMVEGSTNQISEDEFLDALFLAHDVIKKQVAWQKEMQQELGVEKVQPEDTYNWALWEERIDAFLTEDRVKNMYIEDKVQRGAYHDTLKQEFIAAHADTLEELATPESVVAYILDATLKAKLTQMIFTTGKRIDGRAFDQVRKISTEVGLLPTTHGSALFTRGRTQALVTTTLGGGQDEQRGESLLEEEETSRAFMLNYNFPPFSVGDARPMRGPGRREIGHGYLAASSFTYQLPTKEEFPYTIRVVADMLESDGSTSMATTCGTTMALMHTGVPLKNMVSGVAMGMIQSNDGTFQVLTDMSGFEDAFGLMDFKVTGTQNGITAIQMDIKYKKGLPREVFSQALEQAKKGRLFILGEMQKVMTQPNTTLADSVPKVVNIRVATEKIGAIIGGGGKVIREIIEKTNTNIDIESDGQVRIFGKDPDGIDRAIRWVKTLAGQIDRGAIYEGKIKKIAEFGLFVELVPGQDGLVHVSNIPREKQRTFTKDFAVDQVVKVEVVSYDSETGRIRLKMIS